MIFRTDLLSHSAYFRYISNSHECPIHHATTTKITRQRHCHQNNQQQYRLSTNLTGRISAWETATLALSVSMDATHVTPSVIASCSLLATAMTIYEHNCEMKQNVLLNGWILQQYIVRTLLKSHWNGIDTNFKHILNNWMSIIGKPKHATWHHDEQQL